MTDILEKIVARKRAEVAENRVRFPEPELQASAFFSRQPFSLRKALLDPPGTGIIAEFKRRSPSKGMIHVGADVVSITKGYTSNGAAAISVLTDRAFFGGSNADLTAARVNDLPILRKDFIIDKYQIVEAKSIGADVILLIAACLSPAEVQKLAAFAHSLGLEVLLEIHNERELEHICEDCDVIGVNNRDLRSFTVDVNRSLELSRNIPPDKVKISESGLSDTATIRMLRLAGFRGFLIGENFMKQDDPAIAFASFVKHLKTASAPGEVKQPDV